MLEVRATDLGGRIGRLKTRSGTIELPAILPVVHPWRQVIPCRTIREMGFEAVMTNAFITMKKYEENLGSIHRIIDFDGVVMTDSGGYQVLSYGQLDVSPLDMVRFQEEIESDIGVILDTPTGLKISREKARKTVMDTIQAGRDSMESLTNKEILWTGPIQGGKYLDLVAYSATEMSKLPFGVFALGSPTMVMESYDYDLLLDMIGTAKMNIPLEKPLHLFGLGHPLSLPLAVAMGCDIFDSASYALYAKDGRYLAPHGTYKIEKLDYFPCSCPVCVAMRPKELLSMDANERLQKLSMHNLYALLQEVRATKQAIRDGRLWDHVASKARYHPKVWEAFVRLKDYNKILEDGTPIFKTKALYLCISLDAEKPEVERHHERMMGLRLPRSRKFILLVPLIGGLSVEQAVSKYGLNLLLDSHPEILQVCGVSYPWGLIPVELSLIYPLSQNISTLEANIEHLTPLVVKQIRSLVGRRTTAQIMALDLGGPYSFFFDALSKILPCKVMKTQRMRKREILDRIEREIEA